MNGIDSICKITVSISEMFRYSIQENLIVQLQDELREINNCVTIQTIRFKDRLYADFDVEEEVLKVPIPDFFITAAGRKCNYSWSGAESGKRIY